MKDCNGGEPTSLGGRGHLRDGTDALAKLRATTIALVDRELERASGLFGSAATRSPTSRPLTLVVRIERGLFFPTSFEPGSEKHSASPRHGVRESVPGTMFGPSQSRSEPDNSASAKEVFTMDRLSYLRETNLSSVSNLNGGTIECRTRTRDSRPSAESRMTSRPILGFETDNDKNPAT